MAFSVEVCLVPSVFFSNGRCGTECNAAKQNQRRCKHAKANEGRRTKGQKKTRWNKQQKHDAILWKGGSRVALGLRGENGRDGRKESGTTMDASGGVETEKKNPFLAFPFEKAMLGALGFLSRERKAFCLFTLFLRRADKERENDAVCEVWRATRDQPSTHLTPPAPSPCDKRRNEGVVITKVSRFLLHASVCRRGGRVHHPPFPRYWANRRVGVARSHRGEGRAAKATRALPDSAQLSTTQSITGGVNWGAAVLLVVCGWRLRCCPFF